MPLAAVPVPVPVPVAVPVAVPVPVPAGDELARGISGDRGKREEGRGGLAVGIRGWVLFTGASGFRLC